MPHERPRVIVVTRPERIVIAETKRLMSSVEERGMHVTRVIANYVTPDTDCSCDRSMRSHELAALKQLGAKPTIIERRDTPPASLSELAGLFDGAAAPFAAA